MKNTLIALVAAFAFGTSYHASAQSLKIGTVDMKKVFDSYYKTKDAEQRINEERNAAKKELEDRMDTYRKLTDDIKKLETEIQKAELSKETREAKGKQHDEKFAELKSMEREIQDFQNTRQKQLEDQSARMRANIVEEIQKVISDRVRNDQYDLVFDKSGPTLNGVPAVLYARDSFEFTSDIITFLNKNKGRDDGAAVATPAAATPSAADATTPKPGKKKQ